MPGDGYIGRCIRTQSSRMNKQSPEDPSVGNESKEFVATTNLGSDE
jgi:hypothetical protein